MATAIYMQNAKNVILKNVTIRGFDFGIVSRNCTFLANRLFLIDNKVGIYAENSLGTIYKSYLNYNRHNCE